MDFRQKVVYQIYPKSFKDSNGDGIGDLRGIIQKLPYLKELGVDVIWFNPFFPSPQNDNGYDISDYKAIDPLFGTMADFEELVEKMKELDMEIMLDMVLNHTSTEHEWFQKALQGDKKYQDYYILRPGKNDNPPTNWESKFGGNAWAKFGQTDLYYLHLYDVTQADLNWRNPAVRQEAADIVNFWIDKGVTGFRFDVINVIGKDEELIDATDGVGKYLYTDKPIVHEYLQELNQRTFGRIESITVGEMSSTSIENCILYTNPERHELNMTFNFHHLKVDYVDGKKWTLAPYRFKELKELLHTWNEEMSAGNGWNAWFWNNHDQPRALTRFGNDCKYRIETAKLLATAIHLNRGTPFIYQGEEIGMTDPYFEKIEDYRDVETLNYYQILMAEGKTKQEALAIIKAKSRDNSRTPMQWDDSINAGFSESEPWIPVAKNYLTINVKEELANGSIFKYYQDLIAMRKQYPTIAFGDYQAYQREHPDVYAFIRSYAGEEWLVLNNFKDKQTIVNLEEKWVTAELVLSSYGDAEVERACVLRPYEAIALRIKEAE